MEEKAKAMHNRPMNNKYLKPELDTPYTVALKYPTPIRVKGFDGWQMRYILMDGRALYMPQDVKPQVDALDLKPGQSFTVEIKAVGRKREWSITRNQPQPAIALVERSEPLDGPYSAGVTGLPPTQLEDALKTAVAAAAAAEKHGQQIGYAVRFRPEDIRALGITVLIGMQQKGRAA
jgi:hypothetical protein